MEPQIYAPQIKTSDRLAEVEISYRRKIQPENMVPIISSADAYDVLRSVWSDKIEWVEEFLVLFLNAKKKVLGWAKISQGGLTGTFCDPKIIFQFALKTNCHGLILCHNHTSGDCTPSPRDKELTKQLVAGGKLLEIGVIDHIILSDSGYFSFVDNNLL